MKPRAEGGVVDSRLSVYGTQNLKCVDLSICPVSDHHEMSSWISLTLYRTTWARTHTRLRSWLVRREQTLSARSLVSELATHSEFLSLKQLYRCVRHQGQDSSCPCSPRAYPHWSPCNSTCPVNFEVAVELLWQENAKPNLSLTHVYYFSMQFIQMTVEFLRIGHSWRGHTVIVSSNQLDGLDHQLLSHLSKPILKPI